MNLGAVKKIQKRLQAGDVASHSKSEKQAEAFKKQGNAHFRRRELPEALHCYGEAAFTSPWPLAERQRILSHLLDYLEPPKKHIAARLFPPDQKADDDHEPETSLLSLCIGNRSAVLYEMNRPKECLADIGLALSLGFPAASQYKLYRRRGLCLAQLGDRASAISALETSEEMLSTDRETCIETSKDQLAAELKTYRKKVENLLQENRQSSQEQVDPSQSIRETISGSNYDSYVSRSIKCDSSPSKGRFITVSSCLIESRDATRDIEAGEVVLSERASAAVLNCDLHLTHCSHCFHNTSSLTPCCWCASDGYCSSQCRKEAWVEYHWLECPVSNVWIKANWMMSVALRMLVSAPASVLQEVLLRETPRQFSTQPYTVLLSLVSHKEKFSDSQQRAMFSKMAETLMDCFGDTIKGYLHSQAAEHHDHSVLEDISGGLRDLFLHHLLQLRCNSHRVTVVLETGGLAERGEMVQTSHEVTLGSAVFPTASLFNHSCWPNIIFRFQGNNVEAVATRPIRRGEEATNCYGPQLGRMKRAERVAQLQAKYFFHCFCPACVGADASLEYREQVVDAYLCPGCSGAVIDVQTQWQCRDCHRDLEPSNIGRIQELVGETERMFSAATVEGEMDLPLLLKCHSLQSQVLHRHNMQLARTCDALAQAHASIGELGKAAEFCAASCQTVEAVHGSHSIELATELHKLAQLLFNSGQYGRVVEVVERALPLLTVYYPPDHPDITELEQIKNHLCT